METKDLQSQEQLTTIGEDCAYAAGLMDGEGCISICWSKPDQEHNWSRYYLKLSITMCDRVSLFWLQEKFGGILRERKWLTEKKPNMKRQWLWSLGGGPRVAVFLEKLMPHLKVKKPQAELAIAFQSTVFPKGGDTRGKKRMTEEKQRIQHSMYVRMRELKKEEVLA